MVFLSPLFTVASLLLAGCVNAEPVEVKLGRATVVGDYNVSAGVEAFLGVKYADHKRFERAVIVGYEDRSTINVTAHAPACAQVNNATGWNNFGYTEDCLFLEVYRPHAATADRNKKEKIPVLVFIHGGGGTSGAANAFLGYNFVKQSQSINMPVIVVTINYRLAAWGMLGGKEASKGKAVNLALYDQRIALQWVQKNIGSFGGDTNKVTLWGLSSGSMSTHLHYLDQNSKLFRAAIMQSGNANSVPALDTSLFQSNYDALVAATGCNTSPDTLACLKTADFTVLENAVNKMMANTTAYSTRPWGIVIDGGIVPDVPSRLIAKGKFAKKPFIHGRVMDEGTFYPKPTPMETVEAMWSFFKTDYVNKGSTWLENEKTKAKILELYPGDPASGSPFNTGSETFGFGAQFKRAAALYGDIRYQSPGRSWLADAKKYDVKGWAYQLSQFTPSKNPAAYGVYHTADIAYVFLQIPEAQTEYYNLAKQMVSYFISFAYNMNPNRGGYSAWPTYGARGNLMNFTIADTSVVPDTFRKEAMAYLNSVQDQFGNPTR